MSEAKEGHLYFSEKGNSNYLKESKDYNSIVFYNAKGWVVKITEDGNFEFNHDTKMNADEFAKEFIDILEKNVISRGE